MAIDPLGPALASNPITPSKRTHEEVNAIIQDFNGKFGLTLPVRNEEWSPNKLGNSRADWCVEKIKFLYFSSRPELNSLLDDFSQQLTQYSASDRLERFTELLGSVVGTRQKIGEEKRKAKMRIPGTGLSSKRQLHQLSRTTLPGETGSGTGVNLTLFRTTTPEREGDEFQTPPESPALQAS